MKYTMKQFDKFNNTVGELECENFKYLEIITLTLSFRFYTNWFVIEDENFDNPNWYQKGKKHIPGQ